MNDLKGHFILVQKFLGILLQGKQFIAAKVALVIGGALPGKDWLAEILSAAHLGSAWMDRYTINFPRDKSRLHGLMDGPLGIEFRRDDLAIAHVDDAVAETGGLRVVRDHHDCLAQFLIGLTQHVQHDIGILGI